MTLTAERLRELLDYDPTTGHFAWRVSRGNRAAGSLAGREHGDGYWQIKVDGREYLAHRLAWLYVLGVWPTYYIDHKDLNGRNNAILNLREASNSQNMYNAKKRSRNLSGFKGASKINGSSRWSAMIGHQGEKIYLGTFATAEEAHQAYCAAAAKLHGEFARTK